MTPLGDGTGRRPVRLAGADGVPVTATCGPPRPGRPPLLIALPVGTTESIVAEPIVILSRRFNVFTWEARLVLDPEVSLPDPEALAVRRHCDDAATVLDHFGADRAHVIGYCSGASIALHFASACPTRVERLALVNGAYFLPAGACERTQYERDVIDLVPALAADRAKAEFVFTQFFRDKRPVAGPPEEAFAKEFLRPYRSAEGLYRYATALANFCAADPLPVARAVAAPTLVLTGGRDDRTHQATSALIAAAVPGALLDVEATGDHYAFARGAPPVLDRLMNFLGGA